MPDEISNDLATLVEPVAAALQIPEQVSLAKGMSAVVVGDGRLGNLCAQVLSQSKCKVTVVGKHPTKLDAFSQMGIPTRLADELDAVPSADLVVDCAGSASGLATALSLVRPRGTIVMKTTVAREHQLAMAQVVIDEITIVGSRCGPFKKAIQALQMGQFRLESFVSGRFPLEQYAAAFERAVEHDALKVIVEVHA